MENFSFARNRDDRKTYIVIYDITDNKRRYKVSKTLEAYGRRIQKSAFECHINSNQMKELRNTLFRFLKNEDDVKAYATISNHMVIDWCKQETTLCSDLIIC